MAVDAGMDPSVIEIPIPTAASIPIDPTISTAVRTSIEAPLSISSSIPSSAMTRSDAVMSESIPPAVSIPLFSPISTAVQNVRMEESAPSTPIFDMQCQSGILNILQKSRTLKHSGHRKKFNHDVDERKTQSNEYVGLTVLKYICF